MTMTAKEMQAARYRPAKTKAHRDTVSPENKARQKARRRIEDLKIERELMWGDL